MALTDEAIERIKEMIVSGDLRPGDRLPNEADLAGRLGLSRNSLREAVRALSLMRVLDVRQATVRTSPACAPNCSSTQWRSSPTSTATTLCCTCYRSGGSSSRRRARWRPWR
jgi:DNA-binding FadR family transcriptional regulator